MCIKKFRNGRVLLVLVEMENFFPLLLQTQNESQLKVLLLHPLLNGLSFATAEIINLSKFFQLWAFLKGSYSCTKKSHTAKNFLSNFLTCTTKYNYNGLDLAKSRVWVQCTLLPKRSNVTAVGWKSIHLLHRIATLHAWLERIIYGKRKIWD